MRLYYIKCTLIYYSAEEVEINTNNAPQEVEVVWNIYFIINKLQSLISNA